MTKTQIVRCRICNRNFEMSIRRTRNVCDVCNYEIQRVNLALRRTKYWGLASTLTLDEWLQILKRYKHRCAYCGGKYQVLEHIRPVFEGGGTTKENCVPACKKCNNEKIEFVYTSKGTKPKRGTWRKWKKRITRKDAL